MSAAQARASAPENLPALEQGFQAASCSLFFDSKFIPENLIDSGFLPYPYAGALRAQSGYKG